MGDILRVKRGNKAQLPALAQGELAYCLDEKKMYVGGLGGNECLTDITKTTADITYYVRTDGADTNDGLVNDASRAFKTIGKAIGMIPQIVNHTVNIYVATGTYNESVTIAGFVGKGNLALIGGNTYGEATNYKLSNVVVQRNSIPITVKGFEATTTTTHGFIVNTNIRFLLTACRCVSASATYSAVSVGDMGFIQSSLNEFSNRVIGISSNGVATVYSRDNTGIGNTYGLYADGGSTIVKWGTQCGGTTAQAIDGGGLIR